MCDGKNHPLIVLDKFDIDVCSEVVAAVRWCPECGGVVIDKEVDGRRMGVFMSMRFPKVAYKYFKGGSSK